MITNDRQYRLTRSQAQKFRSALDAYDEIELVKEGIDPVVVEAQRRAIVLQLRELDAAIADYEALRSGDRRAFVASGPLEIGETLVQGRVARGLTQRDLAIRLGMPEQQVQRYEQERYRNASLSRIAEIAEALQLAIAAESRLASSNDVVGDVPLEFDAKKLPAKEMKKRGWLSGFDVPRGEPRKTDIEIAAAFIAQATGGNNVVALHYQKLRLGAKADRYSLLAWKARVLQRAKTIRDEALVPQRLDPIFIKKLVRLSQQPEGVVDAVKLLRSIGILVVFEEHLPATYLDGAALLLDDSFPVIGMTLRHDRLDNFWFVLLHELGHIARHRDTGLREGFFDDDATSSAERFEREADEFAINALIPDEIWKNSFVRFSKSADQVVEFASRFGVGPAVVAGRIRHERRDFSVFSDLVGAGEVRARIREANL